METPEESAAVDDFRNRVWIPFQQLYEAKWDQAKWNAAVEDFVARHDPAIMESVRAKGLMPPWDALEAQIKRGPPPFLRPGWVSPLVGRKMNLDWIDHDSFVRIRGTRDGWRHKKVLLIEFWASWCRPCHRVFGHLTEIAAKLPEVKVITFNAEGIFSHTETDIAVVKAFVAARNNMNYPIFVDVKRVAIEAIFRPGQNLSIPLVFIITPRDGMVHWIGNAEAEDMEKPLKMVLATL